MQAEITFRAEPGDDTWFGHLDGKRITVTGIDRLALESPIDLHEGPNGLETGEAGTVRLDVHGNRAVWSEAGE